MTVISVSLLTSACAVLKEDNSSQKELAPVVVKSLEDIKSVKTVIDPNVMFLLLAAEVAGQRQQYGIALDGYLRAAALVKDETVIRRAMDIALFVQNGKKLQEAVGYWLEQNPKDLEAHTIKAVALILLKDEPAAVTQLKFILEQDAEHFNRYIGQLIKSLNRPVDRKLSYQVIEKLSQEYPENVDVYFSLAYLDFVKGRYTQAKTNIERFLDVKTEDVKGLLLLAQIYIKQEKWNAAVGILKRTLEQKDSARVKEQMALLLLKQNKYAEAKEIFQDLHEQSPQNYAIRFQLALVLLQLGDNAEAKEHLLTLFKQESFKDQSAYYLGRVSARESKVNDAIAWFDEVNGQYKYEARVGSVLVLIDDGQLDSALQRVKQIKENYSNKQSELSLIESDIYSRTNFYQQAFDVLSGALLKDAENEKILYARALIAEKLGNLEILEDDLKYILEKNPKEAVALNALGYTLADRTERYKEAKIYIERALALRPNEAVFLDSYGWVFFKMGELEQAYKYLSQAYEFEPQAEIAGHLVEVLFALGQRDEAQTLLKKGLKLYANDSYLLRLKQQYLDK